MLQYPIRPIFICLIALLSGCKHEIRTAYYADGQVQSVDSLDVNGLVRSRSYFRPDGTLERTVPVEQGHVQGLLRRHDAHGKLAATEEWAMGHQLGVATGYYPNGRVWFTKTMRDSTLVDTSRVFYPNGQEKQVIVRTPEGRRIDFAAWHPNGLTDTSYTRVIFLSDADSVRQGQDYAFEIRLGNRRSNHVTVSLRPVLPGLDSAKGKFAATRYTIRHPTPGTHLIRGSLFEEWARKGSDTIWTNAYRIQHTFHVVPTSSH